MAQFSFPLLDDAELLACLEEMECPLDASQLNKPTYETVKPLFEQIVILLTGVTREELTQPVFTAMDAFEFPELHDESIPTNNFFKQLCKLMGACGVKDFSWRDVFKPEPPRLRRALSGVVNFAKFREEKALALQELQAQLDGLVAAARAMEEEHARNTVELRRVQAERAEQAAEVAHIEAEDAEVCARNQALMKSTAAMQNEARNMKAQLMALTDEASSAKLELSALQQETEALQDQVVQSPDKHRQAIAELAAAAEAKRTYCATLSSNSIDNDKKLEMVAKVEKEVSRCIKLLEELEAAIARKKDVSQQAKDLRGAIAADERHLAEIASTNVALKRQQATVLEKFQRLEHQAALKMEAAASLVEEQMKSREAVEAENAAAAARAAEDDAMIRSIRERMQELQAAHEAQVRGVLDKYSTLRKAVNDYNKRLEVAMAAS